MKKLILFSFMVLLLPTLLSINIDVDKSYSEGAMIKGLDEPTIFDLTITNNDRDATLKFMNFEGFVMEPETIEMKEDETKFVELKIFPKVNFDYIGFYILKYTIFQGEDRFDDEVILKIMNFQDAFKIGAQEINPDSNSLKVYVENKENYNFEKLNVKFSSAFFDFEETFNLKPKEKKAFEIKLNKEDFKKLIAGFYTLNADISSEGQKAHLEGLIKFNEKDILTTTKREFGFVIASKIIEKENQGNVITETSTTIKKNIISRLFTSFSPEPEKVERDGSQIYYMWNQQIRPGEVAKIAVKTNWLYPFLIVLVIVVIVVIVKQSTKKHLKVRKNVSFVKSKGGEFALKVTLNIHARNYVERVRLIDRIPPLVKLYERFGVEKPIRADEKTRRIEWAFEKLEAGETRVLSYVIYSKVAILGRFILPSAVAIFERDSQIHEVKSNQSFFMAETKRSD